MQGAETTRELTADELAQIELVMLDLTEHFSEWKGVGEHGTEHELIEFAVYEGCSRLEHCRDILERAAPLALGRRLIALNGFSWAMAYSDDRWQLCLKHPRIAEPILLSSVCRGEWNRESYDEPPDLVRIVTDSYEAIFEAVPPPWYPRDRWRGD
jgi:hypothetical protein